MWWLELYQDLPASNSTEINFHDLQECSVFWLSPFRGIPMAMLSGWKDSLFNEVTPSVTNPFRSNCVGYSF